MEKSLVITALLLQDRLIRYNLQMLEMLMKELRADIEELNFLAEACLLEEEEIKVYKSLVAKADEKLFTSFKEAIEYLYDLYEVFNFEITLLANLPEELLREVERLNIPTSINEKMEGILRCIEEITQSEGKSQKLYAMLTPFRAYREVIRHALDFNRRLFESHLQRTE
ncbi:MAG: hypothetical protein ACK4OF_00415 [Aquificaceae bacterium]